MKSTGYKKRDSVSHRKTNIGTLLGRFKRGKVTYRGKGLSIGSGHRAGEKWAASKGIDPDSDETQYSKNSPSFDEGVWQYKQSAKGKALSNF